MNRDRCLETRGCESLEQVKHSRRGATFLSTRGPAGTLSNYITGYGLHEDGGVSWNVPEPGFLESLSWTLKHGPATQGTQQMRDGGSPQPSPSNPPHASVSSTRLSLLSEEGPQLPPGHLLVPPPSPLTGCTQGPLSFHLSSEFQPSLLEPLPRRSQPFLIALRLDLVLEIVSGF